MVTRIAHVCIFARDLSQTERFYCDALGMTKRFDFFKDGAVVGYYLDAGGGTFIEVFGGGTTAEPNSNLRHLCLETDDLDALRARLAENGVAATEKSFGCDNAYQVWCRDPNGVDVEFHQYTDKSLQITGGVARLD